MVLAAIAESRLDLTRVIVLALAVERFREEIAILPQIVALRDMCQLLVQYMSMFMNWLYGWYYHGFLVSQASHKGKNVVWDDIIGSAGVQQYLARHSRGWSGPAHAATS